MNPTSLSPTVQAKPHRLRGGVLAEVERALPEETPVVFVYDASAEAVMMATPADLHDFAVGFSLTEGVVRSPAEIRSVDVVVQPAGVELRIWLAPNPGRALARRRRTRAGPTGCGLCGVESLAEALRPPPRVRSQVRIDGAAIVRAMQELSEHQALNRETRAVHAAALFAPEKGILAVREDVGRHNALDKLAGALAREGVKTSEGVILLTSRVSVELVQKAAAIGAPILAAVSAPTALALRVAEAAGLTLVGVVRDDGLEVFTGRERISTG